MNIVEEFRRRLELLDMANEDSPWVVIRHSDAKKRDRVIQQVSRATRAQVWPVQEAIRRALPSGPSEPDA